MDILYDFFSMVKNQLSASTLKKTTEDERFKKKLTSLTSCVEEEHVERLKAPELKGCCGEFVLRLFLCSDSDMMNHLAFPE